MDSPPDRCHHSQPDFVFLTLVPSSSLISVSRCFGEDTCITIPDIEAVVMVLQPSEPRITITGVERLSWPVSDLRAQGGISLFQDLHIISTVTRADAAVHHTGMDCTVHSFCDIDSIGNSIQRFVYVLVITNSQPFKYKCQLMGSQWGICCSLQWALTITFHFTSYFIIGVIDHFET